MLSTILLFLQNTADIGSIEREMQRGNSIEHTTSFLDTLANPYCCIPLLIIVGSVIYAYKDVIKGFTKRQIIITVSCLIAVIAIGSIFLYQRNENLKKAEAERKEQAEVLLKKFDEEAREKAKQSPEIVCNSKEYSAETCKRMRAMTVDEIIEVANSFETKIMQFAMKNVPSITEKCKKENIKPDDCEKLTKDESMKALEVVKAIQNTVPVGGKTQ